MKITAAVLREINKGYSIEQLELDPPKAGEVLVKYAYAGYCHSDLSNSKGFTKMQLPMVAGHEAAGVVQEVGPGVTQVKVGDHVASAWMCPCGECPECRKGLGNIFMGAIDTFVGFLEFFSEIIRIVSFTFRLFGNMTGGEILILILFFLLGFAGFGFIQIGYLFEVLVGVVQALIFSGLTLVFATMAAEKHEGEHTEGTK